MIFCFSGTGNSLSIAHTLAAATNDEVCLLTFETEALVKLSEGERIGLIFPIYGWGLPNVVSAFVNRMRVVSSQAPYIYMVCTCGDDIGRTDRLLRRRLRKRGLELSAAWSVIMPNTYTALPGFDVDSQALAAKKLEESKLRISHIAALVGQYAIVEADVRPGQFAWVKSYILGPLFRTFLTTDQRLHTDDRCVGCKCCEKVCPVKNIRADRAGHPQWMGHCTGCLACYHHCPTHSLQCGAFTKHKGQYQYPH